MKTALAVADSSAWILRRPKSVSAQAVIDKPWLLKALAVGTVLDVDIIESQPRRCLLDYWKANGLCSRRGYDSSVGSNPRDACHLLDLPDFEAPDSGFTFRINDFPTWYTRHRRKTVNDPGKREQFQPPLVIVSQALHESRAEPKAFLSRNRPMAYSQSYYGFSGASSR